MKSSAVSDSKDAFEDQNNLESDVSIVVCKTEREVVNRNDRPTCHDND